MFCSSATLCLHVNILKHKWHVHSLAWPEFHGKHHSFISNEHDNYNIIIYHHLKPPCKSTILQDGTYDTLAREITEIKSAVQQSEVVNLITFVLVTLPLMYCRWTLKKCGHSYKRYLIKNETLFLSYSRIYMYSPLSELTIMEMTNQILYSNNHNKWWIIDRVTMTNEL